VDGLTRKLRGKIGESLKAVQQSVPLQQATTSSLEALRKYSEAVTANDIDEDYERAVRAAREAVALDSTFALAWRKLAIALNNSAGSAAARDSALEKAARYADKLPDREKYLAIGAWYGGSRTAADRGKALAAYRSAYAADSTSYVAANQLGILYATRREYDSAQRYERRQFELTPTLQNVTRVVQGLARDGHLADAARMLDSAVKAVPGAATNYNVLLARNTLYLARGQRDSAAAVVLGLRNSPTATLRVIGLGAVEDHALITGRLRIAEAADSERGALLASRGATVQIDGIIPASLDIVWRGRVGEGVRRLDAVVAGRQWTGTAPKDRPYAFVATLYAWAGQPQKAREVWARFSSEDPAGAKAPGSRPGNDGIMGEIALAERKYDEALKRFRAADVGEDGALQGCEECAYFNYARVFDGAGQKDSALTYYERYLGVSPGQRSQDWLSLAQTERRLGELYEERKDRPSAITHYSAFVDLWKNADPELQPLVATVRSRLSDLVSKEGK
jgi:tetratricopeptide (TPR) repeat protein